jgi:hypothetical protein
MTSYNVCQTILKILLIISCVLFRQNLGLEAWGSIGTYLMLPQKRSMRLLHPMLRETYCETRLIGE